jgi:hypothetical protein
MTISKYTICIIALFLFACQKNNDTGGTTDTPKPTLTGILSTLKVEHPRLHLSNERIEELKNLRKTDVTLDKYINTIIASSNSILTKSALKRELIGPRLLGVSRDLLSRVSHLALAYRITNEKKYFDGAISNMKTVCDFTDWNPSHFLDVAEMTHGVALGYDWLYNVMSQADRDYIRAGIKKHGLEEYRKRPKEWWNAAENNWNQVCNGGLIVGCLAIAETDPNYALELIPNAIKNLPTALKNYAPDGLWYEGPSYWSYATEYLSFGLSALQSALGTMSDLDKSAGLNVTGTVPMICSSPTHGFFNFADSGENSKADASEAHFFLANLFNNANVSNYCHQVIKDRGLLAQPYHVVWYKAPTTDAPTRALDSYFKGKVEVVTMRSAWNDPNALWLGFKGGVNSSEHSHLDLGSFELEAGGVRWARDLGVDDYNLPGYWTMGVGGQRWTYYRLNSFSHNVPLLGNKNQYELAKSVFTQTDLNSPTPSATVDLTEAYKDFSLKTTRKISMTDSRKSVTIEDNFTLTKTTEVVWGMMTANTLEILRGGKANLRNSTITSRWLEAEIISPAGAEFIEESAIQKAPEKLNTGNTRLVIRLPNQSGQVKIVVKLTPKG